MVVVYCLEGCVDIFHALANETGSAGLLQQFDTHLFLLI